jgi:hypothetical protein
MTENGLCVKLLTPLGMALRLRAVLARTLWRN